jgi:NADPH:quinone reductase-like Zn-dependent oxidoreductase
MMEVDEPLPHPRDVLIRVMASTINIDDIHMAEGTFYGGIPISRRPQPDRPVIPGSDVAGIVVATGQGVRSVQVGEAVFGVQLPLRTKGAWAQFCAVDERWLTKKPEILSFGTAAACGISGLVALSAMNALRISAGMRIVIVGATGGIGTMAVQLATRAGADVIGICGSRNVDRAYRLGCSLVLDYSQGPWDQALQSRGVTRVDRIFDVVGGSDTERMGRQVLEKDGIFVTVVGPERFIGDRPLGWTGVLVVIARAGYRIIRSYMHGPRYILTGPGPRGGSALADVASAAAAGILPPVDWKVPFELEPMREALRRAAAHRNNGRIVIQMDREMN